MTFTLSRISAMLCLMLASVLTARAELSLVVRDFKFPLTPREPQAFIHFTGGEVLLPVHGSNYRFVPNTRRTLAAISYHAVSNYDSIAIVAEVDGCLLILPDMWNELETQAQKEGVVPAPAFSHTYVRAVGMSGDSLKCTFSAHDGEREFSCKFTVDITASRDGISLHIRKGT